MLIYKGQYENVLILIPAFVNTSDTAEIAVWASESTLIYVLIQYHVFHVY